ncbi:MULTISPECIES: phasin family protein [Alteribacter]|uniref:Polyhydroxyalkanoate synthesis regulator phasin n=1 Tax=Alteribacter keqinensis TaxID=2483800 RepID=A0A3M7TW62_9BACI|nr:MULTISPECIES: hypothetical protein [Alteribacter]MBM7097412.1 hypothetical protein [Alteribacter salitolerans]RNA68645.1 hypothetical protein EBO34_01370 [Alteribacter keqinensis]
MSDLLKKGFLIGLGAAITSKEKAEKYFQELIVKGKVTPDEANEMMKEFEKKGTQTEETWNRRSKEKAQKFFSDLDIASKAEVTALEQRIAELDARVASLENSGENEPGVENDPVPYEDPDRNE